MRTIAPESALAISSRFNFAFSLNSHYGVCLRISDEDVALEHWMLASEEAACRTIAGITVNQAAHGLPLDNGQILLLQRGVSAFDLYELMLLRPRKGTFSLQRLGEISALLGGYLLPSPSCAQLGFAVTLDDPEHSTIWRALATPPWIEPIIRIPGRLSGGAWLDRNGDVLAVNQASDSCGSNGIVVDLIEESWRRVWSVSDTSTDRIVLYSPRSRLLVASTNSFGEERLGWGLLGEGTVTMRFPEILHRPGYVRLALALDDCGERLLVHEVAGAVSQLFIYTPADDCLDPLVIPPGAISHPASWAKNIIRFRFSTPSQPPTLATMRLGAKPRWSWSRDDELESQPVWAEADLIDLQGPAGPIEAVVYGGPDWRQDEHLVVALHGGPLASWRFEFHPLFQHLAAKGIAVVAPNYRGSTGYGGEHLRAVLGNWGGPDLEDVLHLGRNLEEDRRGHGLSMPVVLGMSYGAFLALLAACNEPNLWSACVALAPFLSGPRLHKSAGDVVRNRIEKLGGLKQIYASSNSYDVLEACESLAVPLLLIHGVRDETIPVEQSRTLMRYLTELGKTEGADFEYREVDSDHEEVVLARPKVVRQRVVDFCLTRPKPQKQI